MLTTPSTKQHILKQDRIETAINNNIPSKNFLILQKMLNQTNQSIGQLSTNHSIDFMLVKYGRRHFLKFEFLNMIPLVRIEGMCMR